MFLRAPKLHRSISLALASIWLLLFVALLISSAHYLPNLKPDTNVLNLLPQEKQHPLIHQAQQQINGEWQNTVIWLARGDNDAKAVENAKQLQQTLEKSELFASLTLTWKPEQNGNVYSELLPYRFQLLTESDKKAIKDNAEQFADQRLQLLYSPVGMQYAMTLSLDPLFTFGNYTNQLFGKQAVDLYDDVVILRDNSSWAVLISEINAGGFASQKALAELHQQISGSDIIAAGMPLYSAYGAKSAEKEMSTVGTVSIVAIIAFMLLGFRSLSPLLLTLVSISTGVLTAVIACLSAFGNLHIITLVFGSSLISITVDYSFHYFCDRLRKDRGTAVDSLLNVLPGICLGVGSSMIAYGILVFTPFPALQQIGLFSVSGLMAAWLTVVLLFPLASGKINLPDEVPMPVIYQLYSHCWPALINKKIWIFCAISILLVIVGLKNISVVDDIRVMQKPAENIYQQEQKIMQLGRQRVDGQYFITTANNSDELLEKEKNLLKQLDTFIEQGNIKEYQAISTALPTTAEQHSNWQLLHDELFNNGLVDKTMAKISMQQEALDVINKEFYANKENNLTVELWIKNAQPQWKNLWLGCEDNRCSSVIRLIGIKDAQVLKQLEHLANGNDVLFVDNIGDINHMLKKYRHIATVFLLASLLIIGIFLALFLGLRRALTILAVPLIAQIFALATLALLNSPISMFHVFGLLLALGISMDYSIFQSVGKHQQTVAMAVILSLITSLLAFGLLASSSTAFIQAFGLSLALGIFYAFMLAPLFTYKSKKGL